MKLLNIALLLALASAGTQALADDSHATATTCQLPVETSTHGTRLDIKRVIEYRTSPTNGDRSRRA